jgi:spermidine synthase
MSSTTVTAERPFSGSTDDNAHAARHGPMLVPLLMLFFISGACGLIYQQLWLRQLSLVFGVTVHAVATVLAAFFSGLALGSFLAGRYADRTDRPLRAYGVIEIAVGVLALLTPAGLKAVERFYVDLARQLPDSTAVLTVARFALSFAVLVVPATLLGASLPMIIKSSLVRSRGLGTKVSLLYATNTAGAIAGTLAAGFWLIGSRGVSTSFVVAAAANITVGVVAYVLSGVWERDQPVLPTGPAPAPGRLRTQVGALPEHVRRRVLVVFTISGFAAIALEVVWFRILVLYLDSNTYAFTVMLATVLAGIALGSYLAAPLMRWAHRSLVPLAIAELAVALAALLSVYLLSQTYDLADSISGLVGSADAKGIRFMLTASALAILPTTVLMGLTFPIGLYLWTGDTRDDEEEVGRRVGAFYACNVAGGIVGSILAGFVLVPVLGPRRSVIILATFLLFSGLILALSADNRATRLNLAAGATVVFVLVALVAVPDPYKAALNNRYPGERVLWLEEGAQTTVSVNEQADGTRVMYIDGLRQASDLPGEVTVHKLIGGLPMALHPNPRRALVIGLGGGVTAGEVSAYPGVAVDIVELSPNVVRAADHLKHINGGVVDRDNVDIRIDDGRNYLLVTENRYDVITADIILPEHAGAGKLWSVEYWEAARDALKDDGIMLQWVPDHRSHAEYEMVLRSFLKVFPNATLWYGGTLLVGTKAPLEISSNVFALKMANPEARNALAAIGITSLPGLAYFYSAGPDEIRAGIGNGPLLTDDHPRIEFFRSLNVDPTPANPGLIRGRARDILRD